MRSAEAKRFEVMKTTDRGSAHLSTPDSHQALCIRVEKFYLVEFAVQLRLRLIFESAARPSAPSKTSVTMSTTTPQKWLGSFEQICPDG